MLLSVLRLQNPLSAWTGKARPASSSVRRAPDRARDTHRRTGMGHDADEASKRVGGFYRSAKCARAGRAEERFGLHAEEARAARQAVDPRAAPRDATQRACDQLPAIVSTGLNAPRSTL
ncbi:hypothetical protein WS47_10225 [Burkholderia territorii]|nr:hypothetical protein WS47_10225 [Burkholderia territorii]